MHPDKSDSVISVITQRENRRALSVVIEREDANFNPHAVVGILTTKMLHAKI